MKSLFLHTFIFFLLSSFYLNAQQLDHVQGDLLVQFPIDVEARTVVKDYRRFEGTQSQIQLVKHISKSLNIWLIHFDFAKIHETRFLKHIQEDPRILNAQFNHFLQERLIPNDPLFNNQWQYINTGQSGGTVGADMDMDLAWDISTGGLTTQGDTIVVCVIDNGVQLDHPDLAANLWRNHAEIPNNNIDDDNNGFIDDYLGWNVLDDNDDVSGGFHGTGVAGIIGAVGNNGIGVSGVNWNVKIMVVDHELAVTEARAIEAYSYALVHRKKYNESNGEEGAFVVATNSSWGVNNAFADEAPLWCAMYDTLGLYGILNAGATANTDTNVDFDGDLPTSCPSEYLIAVTNVDHNDEKIPLAAYGAFSIDLGAFGTGAYTTTINDNYAAFGGTSAATPQVAGTIALLYSAPCPDLIQIAKADPKAAAEVVRDYILDGVDPNPSLENITVTGGRLNINNSIELLMDECGSCIQPFGLAVNDLTDVAATFSWAQFDVVTQNNLRWRVLGSMEWTEIENVSSPYSFTDLLACTEYEVQIQAICGNEVLPYTESYLFKTDGCCEAPSSINISGITENVIALSWNNVLIATSYTVQYKESSESIWNQLPAISNFIGISNLSACTEYDIQIRSNCEGGTFSPFGESFTVLTQGCGGCIDFDYCPPEELDSSNEWIDRIKLHTMENQSGNNSGYGNFTEMEELNLMLGQEYPLELQPGYSANQWAEYFLIWIDLDRNGIFTSNEIVYDPGESLNTLQQGTFSIPANAEPGSTRLRIAMQFLDPGGPCSFGQDFGEVEDYCVQLIDPSTDTQDLEAQIWSVAPNPFNEHFTISFKPLKSYQSLQFNLYNALGQMSKSSMVENLLPTETREVQFSTDDLPTGVYFLAIESKGKFVGAQKIIKK